MAAPAPCDHPTDKVTSLIQAKEPREPMLGVKPTHRARLVDGFTDARSSGIIFEKNQIVEWGQGDLLVARPGSDKGEEKKPVLLFIQRDEKPYNGPNDKGTMGGITRATPSKFADKPGVICSGNDNDYEYHWFPRKVF